MQIFFRKVSLERNFAAVQKPSEVGSVEGWIFLLSGCGTGEIFQCLVLETFFMLMADVLGLGHLSVMSILPGVHAYLALTAPPGTLLWQLTGG